MDLCVLFSFRRCPYAIRARWAILNCGLKVILREVDLKNKPIELKQASSKNTVPILIKPNGEIIDESLDIIYWAINHKNSTGKLNLLNKKQKIFIKNLIIQNDNHFKYHLDRCKYPNRYDGINIEEHKKESRDILIGWNQLIKDNSEKDKYKYWLFSNNETIADWSIWPFVRQYRSIDPIRFDNDSDFFYIKKWLDYYLNHNLFTKLMKKNNFWKSDDSKDIFFP